MFLIFQCITKLGQLERHLHLWGLVHLSSMEVKHMWVHWLMDESMTCLHILSIMRESGICQLVNLPLFMSLAEHQGKTITGFHIDRFTFLFIEF